MPINVLAAAILGAVVVCICAPVAVSFIGELFKRMAIPAAQSDDELKQRMEERSREAYFKQLSDAQKAKK